MLKADYIGNWLLKLAAVELAEEPDADAVVDSPKVDAIGPEW